MKASHPAQAMQRQQGFTLLEVMLAFVLLAVALGLLVGMLSNGLRQVQQAQGETEATLHAQSLLDQLGKLEPIVPGRSDGEFDHGRYRYQLDIQKTDDPAAAQRFFEEESSGKQRFLPPAPPTLPPQMRSTSMTLDLRRWGFHFYPVC